MYNDNFLIEENDLDIAKDVCKLINDDSIRNRAAANVASAGFAKKYFEDFEVDTASGLHNIYQVLEDIDISDVYIKNNYIDVRLYFNENELYVPKAHFDNKLLPVAYMFIKVDEELSGALVTGFIVPSAINTETSINGFYKVDENDLVSFYDIEPLLGTENEIELTEDFNSQIFDYLDNKLSDKNEFYGILLKSQTARENLKNAAYAKTVFNFVSVPADDAVNDIQQKNDVAETFIDDINLNEVVDEDLANSINPDINESVVLTSIDESDILLQENEDIEPINLELNSNLDEVELESDNLTSDLLEDDNQSLNNINENLEILYETDNLIGENSEESFAQRLDYNDKEALNLSEEADDIVSNEDVEELEIAENLIDEPIVQDPVVQDFEDNELTDLLSSDTDETSIDNSADDSTDDVSFEDFSTNTTPSINSYEEVELEEESNLGVELGVNDEHDGEDAANSETGLEIEEYEPVEEKSEFEEEAAIFDNNKEEPIDDLFKDETVADDSLEQQYDSEYEEVPKKKSPLLPIVGLLAGIGILGYYSYTKFVTPQNLPAENIDNSKKSVQIVDEPAKNSPVETAMPVETVENVKLELNTNEGKVLSVPAIEQNLDASISISNLSVEFEVPVAYKTSKTAERYFTKIGKIIQMNLKTELLLLSKQPITNKIAIELEYNKSSKCFGVKGLTASSGEKVIDEVVLKTVKSALDRNLNMNTAVFGNIQGNPVLIIKL